MKVALTVLLLVSVCFAQSVSDDDGSWSIVYPHDGTIAIATSFTGPQSGYVAGGSASGQAIFDKTDDGGVHFHNVGMNGQFGDTGSFLSIRMGNPTWGVAGALGFFGLPCAAVTTDGSSWNQYNASGSFVCAFQGASALDDGVTGVLIGAYVNDEHPDGNGIQMTTDGGVTWTTQDAQNIGTIPVRYGSFLSKDLGYVTSGMWPEDADEKTGRLGQKRYHRLSKHITYDFLTRTVSYTPTKPGKNPLEGYSALLSKVENEGTTWTTMINQTDFGLYFNEVDCADEMNCWAVLEGVDNVGDDIGKIYHTDDGWNTYDVQLTVNYGSMEGIDMFNSTHGWAVGSLLGGEDLKGEFDALFYKTTDGGQTWSLNTNLVNFLPMDVSTPSGENAYAAGIIPVGVSSFAAWSGPSN